MVVSKYLRRSFQAFEGLVDGFEPSVSVCETKSLSDNPSRSAHFAP